MYDQPAPGFASDAYVLIDALVGTGTRGCLSPARADAMLPDSAAV